MGTKFRLSPMIEVFSSRRLEDENRNKSKNREPYNLRKDKNNATEKALPLQNKGVVPLQPSRTEKDVEKDKESVQESAPQWKSKPLPYVEVTPVRSILRPTAVTADRQVNVKELPKGEPIYRNRAPVETGLDIEKIIDNVLDLEVTIPLRNLAGVSGAIQKEIRKQVTKTKQLVDEPKKVHWTVDKERPLTKVETLPIATYMIMEDVEEEIPEGHFVASDPVLQYLAENKDAVPQELLVARESEPLRSIFASINRLGQEECLLDSGSMIISMAKETAIKLGLTWDPTIRISMESATNHLEKTLGIARNVRFKIGGLDLFLQVHILENPPYRVLLGRPFDTFTSSEIRTAMDGSSEMILTDPNSKAKATVPTYERGVGPGELQKQRYQAF
jgi:hypothetical protein